ncbi:hypothetical protein DERP_014758 [Dermatophagoides pteronyssinus]|uniref:Uncharacterized protein n=1 Tax=Dermatophagoides pteronyssinus TaxID=6956 RepID=A0ABQ8JCS9_DERPT|nr:hypothetical protein DERP_014758 [Dermatophagoides pteronyssinus]
MRMRKKDIKKKIHHHPINYYNRWRAHIHIEMDDVCQIPNLITTEGLCCIRGDTDDDVTVVFGIEPAVAAVAKRKGNASIFNSEDNDEVVFVAVIVVNRDNDALLIDDGVDCVVMVRLTAEFADDDENEDDRDIVPIIEAIFWPLRFNLRFSGCCIEDVAVDIVLVTFDDVELKFNVLQFDSLPVLPVVGPPLNAVVPTPDAADAIANIVLAAFNSDELLSDVIA